MAGALPEIEVIRQENLLNRDHVQGARATLERFIQEARPQMDFAAEVPAEVKQRMGAAALEAEVLASLADDRALLAARK